MTYRPLTGSLQRGQITGQASGDNASPVGSQTWGTDTISLTRHAITFPTAFANVPVVIPTIQGNSTGQASILACYVEDLTASVTTTGFNAVVADFDRSTPFSIDWIALDGDIRDIAYSGSHSPISTSGNVVSTININADLHNVHRESVSFGRTFRTPPKVFACHQGNSAGHGAIISTWVETGSVTTTGFDALFLDFTNSANVRLNWIALGA